MQITPIDGASSNDNNFVAEKRHKSPSRARRDARRQADRDLQLIEQKLDAADYRDAFEKAHLETERLRCLVVIFDGTPHTSRSSSGPLKGGWPVPGMGTKFTERWGDL